MKYIYTLKDLATSKILAIDQQPNLLNYLRLGLSDCVLEAVESAELPQTLEQEKVFALRELCDLLEKYRLDYVLWIPIIDKPIELVDDGNNRGFCNSLGIDFDQIYKDNNLIFENYKI